MNRALVALRWTLRLGLGALFAWAGALKLRDPAAFATDIANYQLVPSVAPLAAVTLPMVEVVLGLSLIAAPQAWRRGGALATAGLMALFTAAIGQAVARGIRIECGCFGGASSPVTWWTVARDVLLLAAAVALVFFETRYRKMAPSPTTSSSTPSTVPITSATPPKR